MESDWIAIKEDWRHQKSQWDLRFNIASDERIKAYESWMEHARERLFASNDLSWLIAAIDSGEDAELLSALIGGLDPIPDELFVPMLRAAVYDPNPSLNCRYIYVCLKHWGGVRVNDELFRYTTGTDVEKAGVANAFYHSLGSPTPYDRWTEGPTKEQVERVYFWALEEFVRNEDVQVRRDLIAKLALNKPEAYPEELRPLVPQAIAIAQSHPDEYIRHRVAIELGTHRPLMSKRSGKRA